MRSKMYLKLRFTSSSSGFVKSIYEFAPGLSDMLFFKSSFSLGSHVLDGN